MMKPIDSRVSNKLVILGLSGGVDSAVAAILLQRAGANVQALHMTNWKDDDGYCTAADDLQDARNICKKLGIVLHHVDFSKQYQEQVFKYFLEEYRVGRTPNPDVLCNREIKFGVFRDYAKRLGGDLLATGHYAQTGIVDSTTTLLKGADVNKDQSYFLHAVNSDALAETVFPLGDLQKDEVRQIARDSGLAVHNKKDSTGICFIGERPFKEFLMTYLPAKPGLTVTTEGKEVGTHQGLMYHTLGQRRGLQIGGRADYSDEPWYVVGKSLEKNELIVAQGEHEMLFSHSLLATNLSWIGSVPDELTEGLLCNAKIRYQQPDQECVVQLIDNDVIEVLFTKAQKAVTPGQFVVFYKNERCLGGATINKIG
jgi:tRNA-specific 2-thiouridylase